jgi:hypothetical protein
MTTYRLRIALLSILTTLFALGAAAQASFKVIPPGNVVEGRKFSLTFRLTNADANAPKAPQLDGCTLLYGPSVSTMQSTEIVNGRMSSTSSVDYSFIYSADKAGTVKVPAVSVNAGGNSVSSQPVSFKILPPDRNHPQSQRPQGRPMHGEADVAEASQRISPDDLLIRISFNKTRVYEQEAVIATIKVYTTNDIAQIMPKKQPVFEGFLSEELPVTLQPETEHYNGRNYTTAVLKRCLLYPQKSGKLTVSSGQYDVVVRTYETVNMGYFVTRRPVQQTITTNSNQAVLTVEALPEPRPAGFDGAVGSFSVSTELNPEALRTNEAATYSYIVRGTGNIKYLSTPDIDFPVGMDRYTPKTDIDAAVSGSDMTGTFRVDYTIVPQEPGKFTIPARPFIYFSPSEGKYVTLETKAYDVNVARGAATSVAGVEQRAIDNTITDIRHIHQSPLTTPHRGAMAFHSPLYWAAYVLVVILLVGAIFSYRRTLRLRADIGGRRLARANRVALKRLRSARSFMSNGRNDEFYQELSRAMWGYVSDKLGIAPSQLLRDNIASRLHEYGADDESTQRVIDVLDECEQARFTPDHSAAEVSALYDRAASAIKDLEGVKRKS